MVKVKIFGLFRLESGIKEIELDAKIVSDLYPLLIKKIKEVKPYTKINIKVLNGCSVVVNDKFANKNTKLNDNDVVMLLSPVCGG